MAPPATTKGTMPLQPDDMEMEMESESAPEAETETMEEGGASLPISIFGENLPKVGDRITLEVGSVDADGGLVMVSYEPPEKEDEAKGINALAAKFD